MTITRDSLLVHPEQARILHAQIIELLADEPDASPVEQMKRRNAAAYLLGVIDCSDQKKMEKELKNK